MEEKNCKTCRWWVWDTGPDTGSCHKRAPIAIHDEKIDIQDGKGTIRNPYNSEIGAYWPCVNGGNFCGEYEKERINGRR